MASNTNEPGDTHAQNGTFEGRTRRRKAARHPAEEYETSDLEGALANIPAGEILTQVKAFARESPHIALAGAAAIGFVLGGGLTPRLVGAVGMIAARRYLQGSMKETLDSLLKGV
jgi:hypothetical protein